MDEKNTQEKEPQKAEGQKPEALGWKVPDEEIEIALQKVLQGFVW